MSAHIKPLSLTQHIRDLIEYVGENPDREGLQETPRRFLESLIERTSGYGLDPESVLKTFEDGGEDYDELILVGGIPCNSICEHHLASMNGVVYIGYIPNGKIVGLSKFVRVVEIFARRLQTQERITTQLANCIYKVLQPKAVGVVIQLKHLCMQERGVKAHGTITTTSALKGGLREPSARQEFLKLIELSSRGTVI